MNGLHETKPKPQSWFLYYGPVMLGWFDEREMAEKARNDHQSSRRKGLHESAYQSEYSIVQRDTPEEDA